MTGGSRGAGPTSAPRHDEPTPSSSRSSSPVSPPPAKRKVHEDGDEDYECECASNGSSSETASNEEVKGQNEMATKSLDNDEEEEVVRILAGMSRKRRATA